MDPPDSSRTAAVENPPAVKLEALERWPEPPSQACRDGTEEKGNGVEEKENDGGAQLRLQGLLGVNGSSPNTQAAELQAIAGMTALTDSSPNTAAAEATAIAAITALTRGDLREELEEAGNMSSDSGHASHGHGNGHQSRSRSNEEEDQEACELEEASAAGALIALTCSRPDPRPDPAASTRPPHPSRKRARALDFDNSFSASFSAGGRRGGADLSVDPSSAHGSPHRKKRGGNGKVSAHASPGRGKHGAASQPGTPSKLRAAAAGLAVSTDLHSPTASGKWSPQVSARAAASMGHSPAVAGHTWGQPSLPGTPSSCKRKTCNCKNSKCLKLYCECFASGAYCELSCNCIACHNTSNFEPERKAAIGATLERNPTAFRPKIARGGSTHTPTPGLEGDSPGQGWHMKGCHCKKSSCLKKYCECFQAGVMCSDQCKCIECRNTAEAPDPHAKDTKPAAAAHAAARVPSASSSNPPPSKPASPPSQPPSTKTSTTGPPEDPKSSKAPPRDHPPAEAKGSTAQTKGSTAGPPREPREPREHAKSAASGGKIEEAEVLEKPHASACPPAPLPTTGGARRAGGAAGGAAGAHAPPSEPNAKLVKHEAVKSEVVKNEAVKREVAGEKEPQPAGARAVEDCQSGSTGAKWLQGVGTAGAAGGEVHTNGAAAHTNGGAPHASGNGAAAHTNGGALHADGNGAVAHTNGAHGSTNGIGNGKRDFNGVERGGGGRPGTFPAAPVKLGEQQGGTMEEGEGVVTSPNGLPTAGPESASDLSESGDGGGRESCERGAHHVHTGTFPAAPALKTSSPEEQKSLPSTLGSGPPPDGKSLAATLDGTGSPRDASGAVVSPGRRSSRGKASPKGKLLGEGQVHAAAF